MDQQFPSVASARARLRSMVGLALGLSLLGCGQKGALTLPAPLPPLAPATAASAPPPAGGSPAAPSPRP